MARIQASWPHSPQYLLCRHIYEFWLLGTIDEKGLPWGINKGAGVFNPRSRVAVLVF